MASQREPGSIVKGLLTQWAFASDKPTVLVIDEIDSLSSDTLVSVLHHLRVGYNNRPAAFPQSVILCGVRDVRDYRIRTSKGEVTGASCFNVKAKSLRLGNFSEGEVRRLYEQHTVETGQVFDELIYPRVWALTNGQPWLVNALAAELTQEMLELQDRTRGIGLEDLEEAKERLILRRDTHLDQLLDKLTEDRIRRVMEPIVSGKEWGKAASDEDRQYAVDLGLIVQQPPEPPSIANDIYREIIPRALTSMVQSDMAVKVTRDAFLVEGGALDFRALLNGFQQFYRENSEAWRKRVVYEEAAPQLLLQAWLQRVVNGGGRIEREYALGTGRADILVRSFHREDDKRVEKRFVVEIKIKHARHALATTIKEGLEQTAAYADRCDPEEAHLIVVDPTSSRTRSWKEKIYVKKRTVKGRAITVWGM